MAAVDANAAALAGLERARHFAALHSELFKAQLKDDPSATVEGCFPPEDMLPHAQAWTLLDALAALDEELRAVDLAASLRIFRVIDRPLYDSLRGCSERDFELLKLLVDYLLMPKALIAAVEAHVTVEACKRKYVEALTSYEHAIDTATESRPRLLLFMCLHPCLRDLANSGIEKLEKEAGDSIVAGLLYPIIGAFALHKLKRGDWRIRDAQPAILDGLMGEPISEYGYQPSPIRVKVYAAMCVVMERPLPWDLLPTPLPVEEWVVREESLLVDARPDLTNPLDIALALNRMGAFDDMVAHGMDLSEPWSMFVRRAVKFGHINILERIRSLAPMAFDLSTRDIYALTALESATRSAERGSKAACRWIVETLKLEEHFPSSSWLVQCAACIGDLDMVKRLHAAGSDLPYLTLTYACRNFDTAMVQWLLDRGARWILWPFDSTLKPENREFVLWAIDQGCPLPHRTNDVKDDICESFVCVCQGDPTFLQTLTARGMSLGSRELGAIAAEAASMGYIDLLEWAAAQPEADFHDAFSCEENFQWVLDSALASNQPACVDWMLDRLRAGLPEHNNEVPALDMFSPEHPCYWPLIRDRSLLERLGDFYDLTHFYKAALWDADLDTARWLLARGVKPTGEVVADICAAGEHALPLLRFCVEEAGFDLRSEPEIASCVAEGGSVAMMEYVRSKGCKLGDDALYAAAASGELSMLRWLRSK